MISPATVVSTVTVGCCGTVVGVAVTAAQSLHAAFVLHARTRRVVAVPPIRPVAVNVVPVTGAGYPSTS